MTKDEYIRYLKSTIYKRTAKAQEWGKKAGIKTHKFPAIKMPTTFTETEKTRKGIK